MDNDAPEESEPSALKQLHFAPISEDEMKKILRNHKSWALSTFKKGYRADLSGRDLKGHELARCELRWACLSRCDLYKVSFERSNLSSADLSRSHLFGTNFTDANLKGANFQYAHFGYGTNFKGADLRSADFSKSTGLSWPDIAKRDITGVTLPEALSKFEPLTQVEEISKNARNTFLMLMATCLYTWVIIISIGEKIIFLRDKIRLPIVGLDLWIGDFIVFSVLIILSLYTYLNIYLQRLWESIIKLPAIFPDGHRIDEKIYPWLVSGTIISYIPILHSLQPPLSMLQRVIALTLIYVFPVLTVMVSLYMYSLIKETTMLYLLALLSIIVVFLSCFFWHLMSETLSKDTYCRVPDDLSRFAVQRDRIDLRSIIQKPYLYFFVLCVAAIAFWSLYSTTNLCSWLHDGCDYKAANIEYVQISRRRENWKPGSMGREFVEWNRFFRRDFSRTKAKGAFLAYTEFVQSDISFSDFTDADLTGATFSATKAYDVTFAGAILRDADLSGAIGIKPSDLKSACGNVNTKVPQGIPTPPYC